MDLSDGRDRGPGGRRSPEPKYVSGVLGKYARHVVSAAEGALTS